ncbi:LytR C-terminal domain-containing protein [Bifidobacterium angulatum]|jgi:flagellar biosynthesis GTPase FlhF|uniref:LytR C-terminal domain-containing protein n=1 Tax=Bifidobacterium angulatum TaxID=1683 RepID=UPI0005F8E466|nr:LytR C-terminal domain-containing protein [Bifidobacterium angulatum]AMK57274.1 cell wall integrity and stress response protein 1 [Bifidobacterium angulatum]MEE0333002.1 LytR C-terminal domain-containing protein [Bifidobacterium angulatum]
MTSTGGNGIESYAMDEFDNPPKGPAGVHRGRRSAAARYTPFVVVVVVAALCGFLAWGVLSGEFNKVHWPWSPASSQTSSKTSTTTAKKKAAEKKAAEKKQQEEAAKKQQEEEAAKKQQEEEAAKQQQEQAAQVDRSLSVRVINGTGISGYAATKQSVLNQAGYANVAAANPSGTLPDATVVWYQNDADKATAEDVANALGISNVQQTSGLGASIVVILLN